MDETDLALSSLCIKQDLEIDAPAAIVLSVITTEMGRWWMFPQRANEHSDVIVDTKPGGAITEISDEGDSLVWGRTRTYVESTTFVFTGSLGMDGSIFHVVSFGLRETDGVTTLSFWHEGLGQVPGSAHEQYDKGWNANLRRLAALAESA
jgi:hypothetical protein